MSKDPARQIAESARTFTDPAERAAYLDRVCRGIARLRADVERHLAEMDAGGGGAAEPGPEPPADEPVVARPAAPPVTASESDTTDSARDSAAVDVGNEKAGDRIGRFLLVKELGEGGFGTVWKAEQVEPVKRTVALKIIKLGMDTEQVVARFEQERQALALMDHPNVARVIDAGATRTGRPYFVMDLVQGVPIGEFCDAERLTVEARLEVFAQVCAAVQHAHMKGIIHRDLKPSNVLVTKRDGKPHATVIDFGIAKATSSKLTDRSLVTEAYQVIGTLQYMSPEQSQASPDIDTRTDVYSLGIILYELLTGTTPYDTDTFQRAVLSDILRMIGDVDAPPPSAKITESRDALPSLADSRSIDVKRLASSLRGELDWIVLKSIEKDRARRYESAEAFAADIRRYLAGEEVSAAPPSATYRLRKFVRRNKGPVAAAAAVAAALVAGIVGFAWQAGVAKHERDEAVKARKAEEAERKRAQAVADFMDSTFKGLDPSADDATSGSLKERLVARLEQMSGEFSKLDADPLARARIEETFGSTMAGLGAVEKAAAAYEGALAIRRRVLGEEANETEQTALSLAFMLRHAGRFDDAMQLVTGVRDRRLARGPLTDDQWIEIDEALGVIHGSAGRAADATPHVEAVVRRRQAKGGPDTEELLLALHNLGVNYRETGKVEDAVRVLADAHARRIALGGEASANTLLTANSLAVALAAAGRRDESAKLSESVRDRVARRYPPEHPLALHANCNYAASLVALGRVDDAVKLVEEQVARATARHGSEASVTVQVRWALVTVYAEAKRTKDALAILEEIVPQMTRVWGADHETVQRARDGLLRYSVEHGRDERARAILESELARLSADPGSGGADGKSAVRIRAELARNLVYTGKPDEALRKLTEMAPIVESVLGPKDSAYSAVLHDIGWVHFTAERPKEAIEALDRAWKAAVAAAGPDSEAAIRSHHALGSAHWLAQDFPKAVAILSEALERAARGLGKDHEETLLTSLDLGVNLLMTERKEEFLALMSEWLPRAWRVLGHGNEMVVQVTDAFGAASAEADRHADAAAAMEFLAAATAAQLGPDAPDALRLGGNAATSWWKAGRLDKSLPMFESLVPRFRRELGESSPEFLMALANLGVNLRDAKRAEESLAAFEEATRLAKAAGPEAASVVSFATGEYARTLVRLGRKDEAVALMQDVVAGVRKRAPAGGLALSNEFGAVAPVLIDAEMWEVAEPVLREMVAIREKLAPGLWNHWNARALLGEALMGQKRWAEAEPFVVSGYEGLAARENAIPGAAAHWLPAARERVLRFYAAWDAAEPGKGHDVKLAEWKAKLGK
ncbi:MAG: Serine/threonine-protein kinase PknD [Planctomycetes bacterium]|nr:Serine/threonine-protein kinase PknD [Planctomycetota bacterium]